MGKLEFRPIVLFSLHGPLPGQGLGRVLLVIRETTKGTVCLTSANWHRWSPGALMLSSFPLKFLLGLKGLGNISSNNCTSRVEMANSVGSLGKLFSLMNFGINFPVLFESLSVVFFGLVVCVR